MLSPKRSGILDRFRPYAPAILALSVQTFVFPITPIGIPEARADAQSEWLAQVQAAQQENMKAASAASACLTEKATYQQQKEEYESAKSALYDSQEIKDAREELADLKPKTDKAYNDISWWCEQISLLLTSTIIGLLLIGSGPAWVAVGAFFSFIGLSVSDNPVKYFIEQGCSTLAKFWLEKQLARIAELEAFLNQNPCERNPDAKGCKPPVEPNCEANLKEAEIPPMPAVQPKAEVEKPRSDCADMFSPSELCLAGPKDKVKEEGPAQMAEGAKAARRAYQHIDNTWKHLGKEQAALPVNGVAATASGEKKKEAKDGGTIAKGQTSPGAPVEHLEFKGNKSAKSDGGRSNNAGRELSSKFDWNKSKGFGENMKSLMDGMFGGSTSPELNPGAKGSHYKAAGGPGSTGQFGDGATGAAEEVVSGEDLDEEVEFGDEEDDAASSEVALQAGEGSSGSVQGSRKGSAGGENQEDIDSYLRRSKGDLFKRIEERYTLKARSWEPPASKP